MTIVSLFIYVGIAALALTGIVFKFKPLKFSFLDNFIQNFCGILFIFSGFVKAVDPMGTAFKMEQYFAAFEDTCKGSFLSFLAPVFPAMSSMSIGFSVFMIVLEIVLGVMIIIGYRPKLAAWLFLLIMVFFTILTGFTFLTGYVPTDANFFEFSKWTEFNKNQMRVTDCGCFGDFIKLEPKVSFIKDLILMGPAIWFILRWRKLVQLFSSLLRSTITGFSTLGLLLFCFSNYIWNEPVIDFRPFRVGTDIKGQKDLEQKAQGEVEILAYRIRNKSTQSEIEVPYQAYLDSFKQNPNFKASWETLDQIKTEPTVPRTKISDFDVLTYEGESVTEQLLTDNRYHFLILSPKVPFKVTLQEVSVQDTILRTDTVVIFDPKTHLETVEIRRSGEIDTIITKQVKRNHYAWDEDYMTLMKDKFITLMDSLKQDQVNVSAVFGGLTEEGIIEFRKASGIQFPCYEADDLVLKTIMRSNPGLLLLKSGKIIHKWHHKQLPDANELREKFLNETANKIF